MEVNTQSKVQTSNGSTTNTERSIATRQGSEAVELIFRILEGDVRPLNITSEAKQADKIVEVCNQLDRLCSEFGIGILFNAAGCYVYDGSYWVLADSKLLAKEVARLSRLMSIPEMTSQRYEFLNDLLKQMESTFYQVFPKPKTGDVLINLDNGALHITKSKRRLRPHNKEDGMTYKLDFRYDESATCPMYQDFLDEVLPDKVLQSVLQEYIGYCFIHDLKLEKILLLYGTGSNGKSVIVEIVTALLGRANVTNYSLEALTNTEGKLIPLIEYKLLNVCSDINKNISDDGKFKLLVSGEPIEGRLLYQNPRVIERYAKLMFSLNELPRVNDFSNGFFRRLLIIKFGVEIPPERQDKTLSRRIIENELPGILNWALIGLDRLLDNWSFTSSEAVTDQITEFRKAADSVRLFLDEYDYCASHTDKELLKNVYDQYKAFCIESTLHPLSKPRFTDRLAALSIQSIKGSGNKTFVTIGKADMETTEVMPF